MADEPDNMVLVQLREIRVKLDKIDGKHEEHDKRFDRLDKQAEDTRQFVSHALGRLLGLASGAEQYRCRPHQCGPTRTRPR